MRLPLLFVLLLLTTMLWPSLALADHHRGGEIVCESLRGGYKECYSGFRSPPELVRQLSDTRCREGSNWGHRPGMIWVTRGCRGVFSENGGWGWGDNGRDEVRCESVDRRLEECRKPFRGPAELVRQLSDARCIEGRSWGQRRGVIWVDDGCRAVFAQGYRASNPNWGGRPDSVEVYCESVDHRYQRCDWGRGAGTPYLVDQLSSAPCVRNRSWGYDTRRGYIWVDQGCRGRFAGR
ncbi:MAG: DUF3011 domain-containing protein [Xanthomonadales bacterium]|nr:DUF3011 domain-containing protein [Xanthomonadales bacterium]MCB1629888.1 DUF3011 domain-containing protein [Xanthomonadales bacterium]MCB1633084.1 DUF3011 domain-containing protein [Xanthomonadales bacterium]